MNTWRYVQNGQTFGPVDTATLQHLLDIRVLTADTLVCKEGSPNWLPARAAEELKIGDVPRDQAAPPIGGLPQSGSPQEDIEKNKALALLAYIGPLFLVPLLAAPNSKFARFHANQGVVLFLAAVILGAGSLLLTMIPFIGCLASIAALVVGVGAIVLMVLGIVNAASGQSKPLPLIGHYNLIH